MRKAHDAEGEVTRPAGGHLRALGAERLLVGLLWLGAGGGAVAATPGTATQAVIAVSQDGVGGEVVPARGEVVRVEGDVVRVAVLDLAVVDNSFGGDSERLGRWMREERIEPTALLRAAIADEATYAGTAPAVSFRSIEGARIEEALRAGGVSGRECALECAVRLGRAVGADRVVTGQVTKLSVLIWFVTARAVDVRSGRVLRQDEFEVKGVITDLMPKVMAVLARRFAQV